MITVVITADEVRRLLPLADCIDAVEKSFRLYGEGKVESAVLSVHAHDGAFHTKTSLVGDRFGAKTNANFPGNPAKNGLPSIQGVMLLFDANDGRPLAIMDSGELTALRTAAATAVAAKHLARRNAHSVCIVGCGRQGRMHLDAIRLVRDIKRAYAFDMNREQCRMLDATPVDTLDGIDADIWITCTPSRTAFLRREHVKRRAFVAAVGADNPSKSEITPELMAASRVITDVTDQCVDIGDLHHAITAGVMTRHDVVAELGQVIAHDVAVRRHDDDIVIFDSTGAGFQDVAAASVVYERSR